MKKFLLLLLFPLAVHADPRLSILVDTNGVLLTPAYFFNSNSAALNAAYTNPLDHPRAVGTNTLTGSNTFSGIAIITNAGNTLGGSGAALTALNAGNLASGIVPDARISNNIPRLAWTNTWAGTNTLPEAVVTNLVIAGTISSIAGAQVEFASSILSGGAFIHDGSSVALASLDSSAAIELPFLVSPLSSAYQWLLGADDGGRVIPTTNGYALGTLSVSGAFNAGGISTFTNRISAADITATSLTVGTISNATLLQTTFSSTNLFPAGSDISFGRKANSSLANGNNAGVLIGTNVFVEVSGPTATFTICGLDGAPNRDGKLAIVLNQTGYDMTVAHQYGVEPTAANRIIALTGADRTTTGNGAAIFLYSAAAARWILISFDP